MSMDKALLWLMNHGNFLEEADTSRGLFDMMSGGQSQLWEEATVNLLHRWVMKKPAPALCFLTLPPPVGTCSHKTASILINLIRREWSKKNASRVETLPVLRLPSYDPSEGPQRHQFPLFFKYQIRGQPVALGTVIWEAKQWKKAQSRNVRIFLFAVTQLRGSWNSRESGDRCSNHRHYRHYRHMPKSPGSALIFDFNKVRPLWLAVTLNRKGTFLLLGMCANGEQVIRLRPALPSESGRKSIKGGRGGGHRGEVKYE